VTLMSNAIEQTDQTEDSSIKEINSAMISHGSQIAEEIGANAVLVYVDVIKSRKNLEYLIKESRCILAARSRDVIDGLLEMEGAEDRVIQVPFMDLSRFNQIKIASMLALSNELIRPGDRLVCLSGSPTYGILDNIRVLDVSREFELFSSGNLAITDHVTVPHVFDRLFTLAMDLAEEGRASL
jgi:diadenylate cyclase